MAHPALQRFWKGPERTRPFRLILRDEQAEPDQVGVLAGTATAGRDRRGRARGPGRAPTVGRAADTRARDPAGCRRQGSPADGARRPGRARHGRPWPGGRRPPSGPRRSGRAGACRARTRRRSSPMGRCCRSRCCRGGSSPPSAPWSRWRSWRRSCGLPSSNRRSNRPPRTRSTSSWRPTASPPCPQQWLEVRFRRRDWIVRRAVPVAASSGGSGANSGAGGGWSSTVVGGSSPGPEEPGSPSTAAYTATGNGTKVVFTVPERPDAAGHRHPGGKLRRRDRQPDPGPQRYARDVVVDGQLPGPRLPLDHADRVPGPTARCN